jgi:hypothetical protein
MTDTNTASSAYEVLHLREGAPRDLVDETYWLLVRRLKYGVIEDVEGLRHLDRLNAAYESIVRGGVRQDVASNGHKSKTSGRWSRRKSRAPVVRNPYETLFVTEDADPDIALLASKVLAGRPPSDVDRQEWNDAVRDAAARLEARWHAAKSTNGAHAEVEDLPREEVGTTTAPIGPTDVEASDVMTADTGGMLDQTNVTEAAVTREISDAVADVVVEDEVSPAVDVQAAPIGVDPMDALAASVMPEPMTVTSEAIAETDPEIAPAQATPVADEAASESSGHQAMVEVPGQAVQEAQRTRGWIERLRGRSEQREAIAQAENQRLLSLCNEGIEPTNGHDSRHDESVLEQPALRMEPSGPMTLELSEDEGYDFLLGNHDDPARIQIWHQAGRYLLQQVSGPVASVGGEPLVSPIVVLEDGDEVTCAGDVVRVAFGVGRDVVSEQG